MHRSLRHFFFFFFFFFFPFSSFKFCFFFFFPPLFFDPLQKAKAKKKIDPLKYNFPPTRPSSTHLSVPTSPQNPPLFCFFPPLFLSPSSLFAFPLPPLFCFLPPLFCFFPPLFCFFPPLFLSPSSIFPFPFPPLFFSFLFLPLFFSLLPLLLLRVWCACSCCCFPRLLVAPSLEIIPGQYERRWSVCGESLSRDCCCCCVVVVVLLLLLLLLLELPLLVVVKLLDHFFLGYLFLVELGGRGEKSD